MRAEVIHVTDHALTRWTQRVDEKGNVFEIKSAVKQSRVPRLAGSVYSFHDEVMFIMEPISIDEYRVVTVISANSEVRPPRKPSRERVKDEIETKVLKKKKKVQETLERKRLKEDHGPQRNRSKTRSIHVQSIISGMPDLAPERDAGLQPTAEQDSAA